MLESSSALNLGPNDVALVLSSVRKDQTTLLVLCLAAVEVTDVVWAVRVDSFAWAVRETTLPAALVVAVFGHYVVGVYYGRIFFGVDLVD